MCWERMEPLQGESHQESFQGNILVRVWVVSVCSKGGGFSQSTFKRQGRNICPRTIRKKGVTKGREPKAHPQEEACG